MPLWCSNLRSVVSSAGSMCSPLARVRKVQQQFAHVAVAFAHPRVDLGQHRLHALRVAAGQRVAHQLHLDLQEGQRLGDRIVQLARQQVALLRHGGLLGQAVQAHVFHRRAQVCDQRLQQRTFGLRRRDLRVVEQVQFAHGALVQADRQRHHGAEVGARAMPQAALRQRIARGSRAPRARPAAHRNGSRRPSGIVRVRSCPPAVPGWPAAGSAGCLRRTSAAPPRRHAPRARCAA